MELSDGEKRLLQEMESHLLTEDPRLASTFSGHRVPVGARAGLAVAGLVAGVLVMALGVWRGHALGIGLAMAGFLLLVISTDHAVQHIRPRPRV